MCWCSLPTNSVGVYRNECVLPPDVPTLAHQFGTYETAYIGKWQLAGTNEPFST
jgi:arylsulfatase A-like enzyme